MKIYQFISTISLAVIFTPFLALAQTFNLDEQGIIDEGGIMTNREQEQAEVQGVFLEQERKEEQRRYWLSVGGVTLVVLLVFEAGIRIGARKSKKEPGT